MESGCVPFEKWAVDSVPDEPGIYLLVGPGRDILYIGAAGPTPGLRRCIQDRFNSKEFRRVTHFKWAVIPEPEPARQLAQTLIHRFNPLFNGVLARGTLLQVL
jgi:excinuclease UvrABC nuclease subunit